MRILQRRVVCVAAATAAVIGWGGLLVMPTGASAAIVSINSTIHGYVQDVPTDGTPDSTDDNTRLFISNADAPGFVAHIRPIIEFDISGLTSATTLATLSLTGLGSSAISAPFTQTRGINVLGFAGDGILSVSDFSLGSALTSFNYTQGSSDTNVTLDVTSFINARIAANDSWAGFVLDLPVVTGNEFAIFGNSTATYPVLSVTQAPEPGTISLFAAGVAATIILSRRRRK